MFIGCGLIQVKFSEYERAFAEMEDGFYRAFAERFRGSRDEIKERLNVYLPFLEPFLESGDLVLDLGCGRGEWLEVLQENGFNPRGIDSDESMLKACRELNLSVEKGDALSALRVSPNESHAVVSAIHVVEHLDFDQLRALVEETFRILMPGGLLIMETPNPENLSVSTRDFYRDPTHQRPIPPQLLSFLPEHYGFSRVKIVRSQVHHRQAEKNFPSLNDVFTGVSPDYAVLAQKRAEPEFMRRFDSAFQREAGVTPESLMRQFEERLSTLGRSRLWRAARWVKRRLSVAKKAGNVC